MKLLTKASAALCCILAVFASVGCCNKDSSESIPESSDLKTEATVIYETGDGQSISTFTNPMIPDTTFMVQTDRCTINVIHGNSTHDIFGMPVENAYFADITSDGFPDLCCTLSFGSGIIDSRVLVYDTQTDKEYLLADRFNYDYELFLEDGCLYVRKTPYTTGLSTPGSVTGTLCIEGEELFMR